MIIKIVVVTSSKLVRMPKFDDAKKLGINKKTIKGFTTPPVK